jgi:DNA-binding transcriptional MerR regulator
MDKSPDAFRTISEVADWLGVQAHVLRFWESKFTHVKPVKRAGGRRYYRPADMSLLGGIKKLLHDDGLTIKGVQKILREQGVAHVSALSQLTTDRGDDVITLSQPIEASEEVIAKAIDAPEVDAPAPQADPSELVSNQIIPATPPAPPAPLTLTTPVATAFAEETKDAASETPADPVILKDEPQGDIAVLPSFMHRARTTTPPREQSQARVSETAEDVPAQPTPEATSPPEPEISAPVLQAHVVDAPDPAPESDLPYSRGPLAILANLDALDADQARQIAPLATELRAWLSAAGNVGTA